jgi:hypothetical protein
MKASTTKSECRIPRTTRAADLASSTKSVVVGCRPQPPHKAKVTQAKVSSVSTTSGLVDEATAVLGFVLWISRGCV